MLFVRFLKTAPALTSTHLVALLATGLSFLCCTACKIPPINDIVLGPTYTPQNIYRLTLRLSPEVRRVAVLPMTTEQSSANSDAGLEVLFPILLAELTRVGEFEVVPVSSSELRDWTGKLTWRAEEKLPSDLLTVLRGQLNCDAVL